MNKSFAYNIAAAIIFCIIPIALFSQSISVDAGENQTFCASCSQIIILDGSTVPYGSTGTWTQTAGGDAIIVEPNNKNTQIVIQGGEGTYTFRWTIGDEWDEMNVYFYVVSAGSDQTICQNYTSLSGTNPVDIIGGAAGRWTVTGGSGTFAGSSVLPEVQVTELNHGTNRFTWTITLTNGCICSDETAVTNNLPFPVDAGEDETICDSIFTLNATPPAKGTGKWIPSGEEIFEQPSLFNTQVSGLLPGSNVLQWRVTHNNCTESDYVEIVNNSVAANAGGSHNTCTDYVRLTAITPTIGTGTWSFVSGGGVIKNPHKSNTEITQLTKGYNQLQWTVENNGCSAVDYTEVFNNSVTAEAGVDDTVCVDNYFLKGNKPLNSAAGKWTTISGSDQIVSPTLHNSEVKNLHRGNNVYKWTVSNGDCSKSDMVTIANHSVSAGIITENQEICSNTIELEAHANENGTGYWQLYDGSSAVFADSLHYRTLATDLGKGANIFRWTVEQGKCTAFDNVLITNNSVSAFCGNAQIVCQPSALISANKPEQGEGKWSVVSGNAAFSDKSHFLTEITGLAQGTNILKWTVINGNCTAFDEMAVYNNVFYTSAGENDTVCSAEARLNAENPGTGSGRWSVLGGSATIENPSWHESDVYNLNSGINTFQWSVTEGNCTESDVVIIVNNKYNVSAGSNQNICTDSTGLSAVLPENAEGEWSILSGSAIFDNKSNSKTTVKKLSRGQNKFRWSVTANGCISEADVEVNNYAVETRAGENQVLCESSTTLSADNAFGSGKWKVIAGNGVFDNDTLPNATVSLLYPGKNTLQWTVTANGCSASDNVEITNNTFFVDAGERQEVLSDNASLNATLPDGGTGEWKLISGSGEFINKYSPVTDVSQLQAGLNTFLWSVSKNGCTASDKVEIVYKAFDTYAGNDRQICTDTITLNAAQPAVGTGHWTILSGAAIVHNKSLHNSFVSGLGRGNNILRWSIEMNGANVYDDVVITNNSFNISAGQTQQTCESSIQLMAENPGTGSGLWTIEKGAGKFSNSAAFNTQINNLAAGENILRWTVARNNCTAYSDVTVTYHLPPAVNFSVNTSSGCSPLYIHFRNNTQSDNTYLWQFGDGASSTQQDTVSHLFVNSSAQYIDYQVSLIAVSQFGCKDTSTLPVRVYHLPKLDFDVSPKTQVYPESSVDIMNKSDAGYTDFLWQMGDGFGTMQTLDSYTYDEWGDYTISLTGFTEHCNDTMSKSIQILPPPPIAKFDKTGDGCAPLHVEFYNASLFAQNYQWDFGDGMTSTEQNPEHEYQQAGLFVVSLKAIGHNGGEDIFRDTVVVYDVPEADFYVKPDTIMLPDQGVRFYNVSENAEQFFWDFGDKQTVHDSILTDESPLYFYQEEGDYSVKLTVWSENDCKDDTTIVNVVNVQKEGEIIFPTAFIPKSGGPFGGEYSIRDSDNSVFFPFYRGIKEYEIRIYNRWGILIFYSDDINIGWDGYFRGRLCNEDVYIWKVNGKYVNNKPFVKTGNVTLLR